MKRVEMEYARIAFHHVKEVLKYETAKVEALEKLIASDPEGMRNTARNIVAVKVRVCHLETAVDALIMLIGGKI